MKFLTLIFTLLLFVSCGSDKINPTTNNTVDTIRKQTIALIYNDSVETRTVNYNYVHRFYAVAKAEQRKFGIPVSIILSSAIYNSRFGETQLTMTHNNHFKLITVSEIADGAIISKKYNSAWESYRDFSLTFVNSYQSYYEKLNKKDYRGWIEMIGKHYNRQYSENLKKIIVELKLNELD